MKLEDIILLVVIAAIGAAVWCFVFKQWPCQPTCKRIVVEGADVIWKPDAGLSPMPIKPEALPRPLVEYPDAASTRSLIGSADLEREVKALPRPLIEYSNSTTGFALERSQISPAALPRPLVEFSDSAFTMALQGPQTSPAALPRPLVEYADSAITFALEGPSQELISSAAQAEPRPLVEYADAGWSGSLIPPLGLLKEEE